MTVLFSLLSLSSAHAIPPYSTVYRADSRTIEEIVEAGGMLPWESDNPDGDLVHHFEGESLEDRESVFVSTSSSLAAAVLHAASLARPNSEEPYDTDFQTHIYSVRPSNNFYDVEASLINRRDRSPEGSQLRTRLDRLLRDYGGMEELVAVNGIPAERIMRYVILDGEMLSAYGVSEGSPLLTELFWAGRWETTGTVYNPAYDHDMSSTRPYPVVAWNGSVTGHRLMVRNGTQPEVPFSFSCKGVGDQGQGQKKRSLARVCSAHEHRKLFRDFYDRGLLISLTGEVQ